MGWQSLTKCLQYCLRWTRHPDMLIGEVAACVEKISSEEVKETLAAQTDCKKSENLSKTGKASTGKYLPGLPGKDLTARWISISKSKKCNLDATCDSDWAMGRLWDCTQPFSLQPLHTFALSARLDWFGVWEKPAKGLKTKFFFSPCFLICAKKIKIIKYISFSQQDCRNRGSLIGNKACFLNTNNTQSWTWST